MQRHAWSDSDADMDEPACRHAWSESSESTASSDSEESLQEKAPAHLFVDFVIDLLLCRALNAKTFCILMYYAGLCGIVGCSPFGKRPDLPTGHYQRHLNKSLPLYRDGVSEYELEVPCSTKNTAGRGTTTLPVLVPQEELDDELRATGGRWADDLQRAIDNGSLPECYDTHPIVTSSAAPVAPTALFIDATPYSNVDSLIGFWVVNLLSGHRHLVVALRKALLCKCGCRGWCTFWAIFHYLHWCYKQAAAGVTAQGRHDGKDWLASDAERSKRAGEASMCVYCLLWIKGDWAEYASTLGFPSWKSAMRPCFSCNCTLWDMFQLLGVGPFNSPHRSNSDIDYFTGCARCERVVQIPNESTHAGICKLLAYDKRDNGSRGLAMTEDFAQCGLRSGDRVEPTSSLPDIGMFFDIRVFPASVVFWRPSEEYISKHRNPLFDQSLGISPCRCMTADILHILYLGIMTRLCRMIVWMLIESSVLATAGTMEEIMQLSVLSLQNQLLAWYKRRHQDRPDEKLTRYHMRLSKIGSRADPQFKAKGAETYGCMLFLLDVLEHVLQRIPDSQRAERLLRAGRALEEMVGIWRQGATRLSAAEQAQSWACFQRFIASTEAEEECQIPKRHMLFHVLERMSDHGNPKGYANWMDETLNRALKLACRHVSQQNFERSLYRNMREWLRRFHAKRS